MARSYGKENVSRAAPLSPTKTWWPWKLQVDIGVLAIVESDIKQDFNKMWSHHTCLLHAKN